MLFFLIANENRVFPGDTSEEQRNHASGAAAATNSTRRATGPVDQSDAQHVLDASLYLMRLCLMALGGYEAQSQQREASGQKPPKKLLLSQSKNDSSSTPQRFPGADIATFTLPPQSVDRSGRQTVRPDKYPPAGPDKAAHSADNNAEHSDANSIAVRCVYLARAEEVKLLWVETCKVFASLCGSTSALVANRALYCLQVNIFFLHYSGNC